MKKWIALFLTAAVAAGASFPAFAAEPAQPAQPQTVEVSLDTIEDIMAQYNLNLRTYLNNLKQARRDAEDAEDTDQEDYYDHQRDLAEESYEQNAHSTVLSAKQTYLAYCADNDRLAAAQVTAANAKNALNVSLQALAAGYVSQKDADDLKQKADQAQNALTSLDNQLTREKADLRALLNLPDDVAMTVRPVAADDLDFISDIPSINYGGDVIVMRGNSSKIKSAKLNYEYQQDQEDMPGFTQYTLNNASIALEQARESEEAAFRKLYDAMNGAYTVYRQDLENVQRKQSELAAEQKALSLGYSSRQAVDGRTQELKTLQTTLSDDRNTLFVDYLSYIDMKNGYSSTGSQGTGSQA